MNAAEPIWRCAASNWGSVTARAVWRASCRGGVEAGVSPGGVRRPGADRLREVTQGPSSLAPLSAQIRRSCSSVKLRGKEIICLAHL
jgi:hypothetical protein